jgi:hypothetical protein
MSAICPTCNSRLSCGCQRRSASDGASVCSLCIGKYEVNLKNKKPIAPHPTTPTTPNNLQVFYNPPK